MNMCVTASDMAWRWRRTLDRVGRCCLRLCCQSHASNTAQATSKLGVAESQDALRDLFDAGKSFKHVWFASGCDSLHSEILCHNLSGKCTYDARDDPVDTSMLEYMGGCLRLQLLLVMTAFVRPQSGTYSLWAPGFGLEMGSPIGRESTIYSADLPAVELAT